MIEHHGVGKYSFYPYYSLRQVHLIYYLNPSNETLTWGRLPMSIGLMAFIAIGLGNYLNTKLEIGCSFPYVCLEFFSTLLAYKRWLTNLYLGSILLISVINSGNFYLKTSPNAKKYLIFASVFMPF